MGQMKNGTSPLFSRIGVSSLVAMALHFLEYPKMLVLVRTMNLILDFPEVKQRHTGMCPEVGNAMQGHALRQLSHGQQSVGQNLGKCLEWFSPPMIWDFTPKQAQTPVKAADHLKKGCLVYTKET